MTYAQAKQKANELKKELLGTTIKIANYGFANGNARIVDIIPSPIGVSNSNLGVDFALHLWKNDEISVKYPDSNYTFEILKVVVFEDGFFIAFTRE